MLSINCESYKTAKGFSLIELMIVIAIVGILATISIPSYRNYIGKAKMAGVITLLEGFKPQIEEMLLMKALPASFNGCSLRGWCPYTPTSTISGFHYNYKSDNRQFWVEVALTGELGGGRIQLRAVEGLNGSIAWYCGYWSQDYVGDSLRYTPAQCQNTNLSNFETP